MRLLLTLLVIAAAAADAPAQIIKISFKDPKVAKRFKNNTIEQDGELFVVGEPKAGIKIDEQNGKINYIGDKPNDLWVADTSNPKYCPYKLDKGVKVSAGGKSSIQVNGPDIKNISYLIREQSLYGLTKEYLRRLEEIDDLKKAREGGKVGSTDWKGKQSSLVQAMLRMKSWLDQTLFARAGEKYGNEIEKEQKALKDANAARLAAAKAVIKIVPTPEDLAKIAEEVTGGNVKFHVGESQHVRIVFREEVGDDRVKELLELAENLIDAFRVQFVDPYEGDEFKNYIPDEMFVEVYFGPDDKSWHEKITTRYYNVNWEGEHKEERLEIRGGLTVRSRAPKYVDYWRLGESSDLEGMIAHTMGHHLVSTHYNQGRQGEPAIWLNEAVGNWLSLEYLGRNSVTCSDFKDVEYAKKLKQGDGPEGSLLTGTADLYHRLALDKGSEIPALALKDSYKELEDEDIAKAFSLFSFVVRVKGIEGQKWLRKCCDSAGVQQTFIKQWRAKSEDLFKVTGQDVFTVINGEWQKFAEEQIGGPLAK